MLQKETLKKGNPALNVSFFKRGNHDLVRIAFAGDMGNVYEGKVTPQDVQNHPAEWEAYQAGLDMPSRIGTKLTEIPGFTEEMERLYRMYGIQIVEDLATASDATCQKLGMGALAFRKSARMIVENHDLKQRHEAHEVARMKGGDPVSPVADPDPDVAPVEEDERPARRKRR